MAMLALSRHLSFHARGDAAFVWHNLTGDVAEMSRDVLALLLAFRGGADEKHVAAGELSREQIDEFVPTLRARRFLVADGLDEISPLLNGVPRIPRATVFERAPRVRVFTRQGGTIELDDATSAAFVRCDGERTLGQVLGDAALERAPALLRLARADVAGLKILAKPLSRGGVQLNPAAESTMPYPEIADPGAYARGGPAPPLPPADEPTLASLFAEAHPALRGRTFAKAIVDELERRGAFVSARSRKPRVLALGIDLPLDGDVARDPSLVGESEAFDAIVANETLPPPASESSNAIAFVRAAARALAPSGVLFVIDYAPDARAHFAALHAEATEAGLEARVVPVAEALDMDLAPQALSTTRASWPALVALFAAHGATLRRRAWLRAEIEALASEHGIDLANVHGLLYAPLSERALGLSPRDYWVLVARKPERTLH